jgi:hypothetical protein
LNIFDRASLLIRTPDRWYSKRNNPDCGDKAMCILAACDAVNDNFSWTDEFRVLYEVVLGTSVPKDYYAAVDIWAWNDAAGRTFDEVHTALGEASRRVREQEAAFLTYA